MLDCGLFTEHTDKTYSTIIVKADEYNLDVFALSSTNLTIDYRGLY